MREKNYTVTHIKKELLDALENCYGVIATACNQVRVSRKTFYNYINRDQKFADQVREIREKNIDFVEDKLLQKINAGDTASIIFYLKCKAKHRGWVERQEIMHTGPRPIVVSSEWEGLLEEN